MGDRKIDRMFRRYLRHADAEALGVAFDLAASLYLELSASPPNDDELWMIFVSTKTGDGPRRSMGHVVPAGGLMPGVDGRGVRVVLPPGRTEYEVRLADLESEPLVQGTVTLSAGEEHRISLPSE